MAMIFMVGLAAVDHGHQADGAGVNDGERDDGSWQSTRTSSGSSSSARVCGMKP